MRWKWSMKRSWWNSSVKPFATRICTYWRVRQEMRMKTFITVQLNYSFSTKDVPSVGKQTATSSTMGFPLRHLVGKAQATFLWQRFLRTRWEGLCLGLPYQDVPKSVANSDVQNGYSTSQLARPMCKGCLNLPMTHDPAKHKQIRLTLTTDLKQDVL